MAQTVADLLTETLANAGVKRIWGVTGDSLNGISDSLRRRGDIAWMHVRHEEVAAFAAGAEAQLTGQGADPHAHGARDDRARRWSTRARSERGRREARRADQVLTNDFFTNLLDMGTEW